MSQRRSQVVFDFDGTLVDSAPAILGCFREVLSEHGITPKVVIDSRLIGPPLGETIARISGLENADDIHRLADDFKRIYDREGVFLTTAYAGVEVLLERLHADGCRLHIATNKRARPTSLILDHLNLTRFFDSVYAIDYAAPPYANKVAMIAAQVVEQGVRTETAYYVGDKAEDGEAADANRLAFCFAAWGYGEWDAVRFPSHWHLVLDPGQIRSVIEGCCSRSRNTL